MHEIRIDPEALAFVQARRGRTHAFEELNPARTAHVVVDLQNGFMEVGAPVEVPCAREVVPNVNAITAAMRETGGQNVFLRMTVDEDSRKTWSNWFVLSFNERSAEAMVKSFARNAHHWQLWPDLDVASPDLEVDKTRFGAFVPGASMLHELLQKRGIDTLIVTGTLTNCCCESTARDAMQMNYKIIFVADATAALSDKAHNATLDNMMMLFADVMTTAEIVAAIKRAGAKSKAGR